LRVDGTKFYYRPFEEIKRVQPRTVPYFGIWNFLPIFVFEFFFFRLFFLITVTYIQRATCSTHHCVCGNRGACIFKNTKNRKVRRQAREKKKKKFTLPELFVFSSLLKSIFFLKKMLSFIQYQCLFIVLMQRSYGEPCRVQSRAARPFAKGRT